MKLFTRKEKEEREIFLKANGFLSPGFTLASKSKGRARPEEDEDTDWRTPFERDLDRIWHSQGRRRLGDKTQVVLLPTEVHLTRRLTHCGDTAQVACRDCSFLGLNETLAHAIAEEHDTGHPPFGHAGESVLTEIMRILLGEPLYIFHHAKYGLEIVDRIEKNGMGLNLTYEVRDGILKHSSGATGLDEKADLPCTPEGRLVRVADKIAYTCSDLDDALRVGIVKESDIPQAELRLLGPRKSRWIGTLNNAVVASSRATGDVAFFGEVYEAFETIRHFMYRNVYGSGKMEAEFVKAKRLMRLVFEHVMETQFKDLGQKEAAFRTLDVVACMTDHSILEYFRDNFEPNSPY